MADRCCPLPYSSLPRRYLTKDALTKDDDAYFIPQVKQAVVAGLPTAQSPGCGQKIEDTVTSCYLPLTLFEPVLALNYLRTDVFVLALLGSEADDFARQPVI